MLSVFRCGFSSTSTTSVGQGPAPSRENKDFAIDFKEVDEFLKSTSNEVDPKDVLNYALSIKGKYKNMTKYDNSKLTPNTTYTTYRLSEPINDAASEINKNMKRGGLTGAQLKSCVEKLNKDLIFPEGTQDTKALIKCFIFLAAHDAKESKFYRSKNYINDFVENKKSDNQSSLQNSDVNSLIPQEYNNLIETMLPEISTGSVNGFGNLNFQQVSLHSNPQEGSNNLRKFVKNFNSAKTSAEKIKIIKAVFIIGITQSVKSREKPDERIKHCISMLYIFKTMLGSCPEGSEEVRNELKKVISELYAHINNSRTLDVAYKNQFNGEIKKLGLEINYTRNLNNVKDKSNSEQLKEEIDSALSLEATRNVIKSACEQKIEEAKKLGDTEGLINKLIEAVEMFNNLLDKYTEESIKNELRNAALEIGKYINNHYLKYKSNFYEHFKCKDNNGFQKCINNKRYGKFIEKLNNARLNSQERIKINICIRNMQNKGIINFMKDNTNININFGEENAPIKDPINLDTFNYRTNQDLIIIKEWCAVRASNGCYQLMPQEDLITALGTNTNANIYTNQPLLESDVITGRELLGLLENQPKT